MPAVLQRRFDSWRDRRLPRVDVCTLQQAQIFVLPSRHGVLFLIIGLLILAGGANYQNNMGLLLAFWLGSIGLLSIFITFRNLLGLSLRSGAAAPVYAGEIAQFPVSLSSSRAIPHRAVGIGISDRQMVFADVPADGSSTVMVPVPAPRRGRLHCPRLYLETQAPFGWIRCWSWPALNAETLVYPAPIAPDAAPAASGGQGSERGPVTPGTEDFYALRSFRSGDSLRQIDWKAFARERGLQVRQFVTPAASEFWFRLEELPTADRELQLSWLCFLLREAERSGQRYALDLDGRVTGPSQGDAHLHRCLEQLARYGE